MTRSVSAIKPTSWIQAVRSDFIPENLRWVYDDSRAFKFAFELASRASRDERYIEHRGERLHIKPREFIVGRLTTSAKIGLSPSEFRNFIKKFEKHALIKTISSTKRRTVGLWLGDGLFYINPVGETPSEQPSESPTARHQNAIRVATIKEVKELKEVNTTPSPIGDVGRKTISFKEEDYNLVIGEYQSLKGISLQGREFLPVKQTIKSMFMSGRTPEQIVEVMRFISQQNYSDWTIRTVQMKLPEVLPKIGFSRDTTPQSANDQALVEQSLREGGDTS